MQEVALQLLRVTDTLASQTPEEKLKLPEMAQQQQQEQCSREVMWTKNENELLLYILHWNMNLI